jgi:peptide chain release factor 1
MLDKLDAIRARFDEIGVALTNPAIIADNKKFGDLSKEYRSLEKIVQLYNDYKKVLDDVEFYK